MSPRPLMSSRPLAVLALALEQSVTLVALLATDGRLIYANARALAMLGTAAEDFVGSPFWDAHSWRHDEDERARLPLSIAEATNTGATVSFETSHVAADEEARRIEFTLTPLRDETDAVVAILAEGHDVTERWQGEHALRQTKAQVERLLEALPDPVVAIDDAKRILVFNRAAERSFGWEAAEIIGQPLDLLLPAGMAGTHDVHVGRFVVEAAHSPAHARRSARMLTARRRDGTLLPVETSLATFVLGTERIYFAVLRDLTEQRAAEEALADARRRTELILATTAEGIVGVGADGVITFANAAAAALLERSSDSMTGRAFGDVLHGDRSRSSGDLCPTLTAIGTGVPYEGEDSYQRADGSTFPVDFSVRPLVVGGTRTGAVLGFHDVTDRRAVEAQLFSLSMLDELTGVRNRRGFLAVARQELALARRANLPVLLCYLDIDRFKHINDSHGHAAGDVALRHLAEAIRSTIRESDVVGRIGGDEFVVLAPVTGPATSDAEQAEAIADSWRARLGYTLAKAPDRDIYGGVPLSVSAGWIVCAPDDTRPLESLMAEADRALYAKKRAR